MNLWTLIYKELKTSDLKAEQHFSLQSKLCTLNFKGLGIKFVFFNAKLEASSFKLLKPRLYLSDPLTITR